MTSRSPILRVIWRGPVVEMNPEDMKAEGIKDGEVIKLVSPVGEVLARVKASTRVPRGVLFTTFHYPELPANRLVPAVLNPFTKTPAYKDTRVRIERTIR
ncbi:molybdopterin dinucleotide binding domain-containing protein [Vulcanisaeta sp. JCM 14467]|uniref:molybdopterin dinucleotide binding domain-containing protein n=1 Tax=Vulcanisaeta sp. JCM 14467 TaxID=1295370 RepID=UPI000B26AB63|nr:molybdopterin dinucleotide binding domain-containing protein [Vulcanisaeta sp. JCM 14467]